jgi:hypothetical protein
LLRPTAHNAVEAHTPTDSSDDHANANDNNRSRGNRRPDHKRSAAIATGAQTPTDPPSAAALKPTAGIVNDRRNAVSRTNTDTPQPLLDVSYAVPDSEASELGVGHAFGLLNVPVNVRSVVP